MNESQIVILACAFVVLVRLPRMVERWKAPLLRGPGWFFSVEAPPDFLAGSGARILHRYRWRLFLPWAVELPIAAALLAIHQSGYIAMLLAIISLFTRLNYYLARAAAERQARSFELSAASQPVSTVCLSLEPRSLRDYTNPWMEAAIAIFIGLTFAWLGYRYASLREWHAIRKPFAMTLIYVYIQAGILLIKRGIVRARYVAPAENAAQHLAWRDSLRRLSAALCDYERLVLAAGPLGIFVLFTAQWGKDATQTAILLYSIALAAIPIPFVWRRRLQYLEVARRTRPAKLFTLPDVPHSLPMLCFQPDLPPLLLSTPNGYALNLASVAVRAAGFYFAGFAVLWACLRSLTA
jgi:hypothetical protein